MPTPARRTLTPTPRSPVMRRQPLGWDSLPTLTLTLTLTLCLLPGCGKKGGRIDIAQTTEAERQSALILPVALVEFSDQAPRRLVADLGQVPVIAETDGPVTVILGDLDNQTGIVSSSDFEMAMARMRNNLLNSRIAGSKFVFVENRARMERLAERERVASGGYLADPKDYHPQTTYTLNGDFFRIGRGDTNQYYMEFQLVHFGTNQIVWSDRYDIKQVKGD